MHADARARRRIHSSGIHSRSIQSRLVHSSTARKGHRRAAVTPGSNIRRFERPSAERRFCGPAPYSGAGCPESTGFRT